MAWRIGYWSSVGLLVAIWLIGSLSKFFRESLVNSVLGVVIVFYMLARLSALGSGLGCFFSTMPVRTFYEVKVN
jgi:hypothetical protein